MAPDTLYAEWKFYWCNDLWRRAESVQKKRESMRTVLHMPCSQRIIHFKEVKSPYFMARH